MIFACGKTAWLHCTALNGKVCNYILLNNWNRCPAAISSSTECSILHHFIYHIFYMLSLRQSSLDGPLKCDGTVNSCRHLLGQIWTLVNPQMSVPSAVVHYVFNRLSRLMLDDIMICKATVVICGRGRCSCHSTLINCRWGLWQCSSRAGPVSSLSQYYSFLASWSLPACSARIYSRHCGYVYATVAFLSTREPQCCFNHQLIQSRQIIHTVQH